MSPTMLLWTIVALGSALLLTTVGIYCWMKRQQHEIGRSNALTYEEI